MIQHQENMIGGEARCNQSNYGNGSADHGVDRTEGGRGKGAGQGTGPEIEPKKHNSHRQTHPTQELRNSAIVTIFVRECFFERKLGTSRKTRTSLLLEPTTAPPPEREGLGIKAFLLTREWGGLGARLMAEGKPA